MSTTSDPTPSSTAIASSPAQQVAPQPDWMKIQSWNNGAWNSAAAKDSKLNQFSHPIWEVLYSNICVALQAALPRVEQAVRMHPQRTNRMEAQDYIDAAKVFCNPPRDEQGRIAGFYEGQSYLLRCNPIEVASGMCSLAGTQLAVSRDVGTAFLIPVGIEKPKLSVQATPGVRGYQKLFNDAGVLKDIAAKAVRQQDEFSWDEGGDADPVHRRPREYDPEKPNRITHGYSRILLKDGRKSIVCLMISEADLPAIAGKNSRLTADQNVAKKVLLANCREVLRTYLYDVAPGLDELVTKQEQAIGGEFTTLPKPVPILSIRSEQPALPAPEPVQTLNVEVVGKPPVEAAVVASAPAVEAAKAESIAPVAVAPVVAAPITPPAPAQPVAETSGQIAARERLMAIGKRADREAADSVRPGEAAKPVAPAPAASPVPQQTVASPQPTPTQATTPPARPGYRRF